MNQETDSLTRNKLYHVASESIHTHGAPETQDLQHLVPGGCAEVAVIKLHGVVPVSLCGGGSEGVSGGPCRSFLIISFYWKLQLLAGVIEEVILRFPVDR